MLHPNLQEHRIQGISCLAPVLYCVLEVGAACPSWVCCGKTATECDLTAAGKPFQMESAIHQSCVLGAGQLQGLTKAVRVSPSIFPASSSL